MLRQILITLLVILLPYVFYGILRLIRRRMQLGMARAAEVGAETGFWAGLWRGAPVFLLGLIGCVLAVAVLVAVAVVENDPDAPAYVPPVETRRS